MEAVADRPGAGAARFRIDLKWVILGLCVAIVAYLALVPLGFLLWQSFFTPHTAAKPAVFTLGNYAAAYTSVETAKLFVNSVVFAAGTAAFSLVVGTALAWMNERTNTPFKGLFFTLALVPLIIPGILFTISWIMLASPKIGIFNLLLQSWFQTDTVFFNVYTMWGMIWVDGLHYSP
ncbi:MAG: iron ABC transporter permease, partial [Gammaproteobacteria bacterium]